MSPEGTERRLAAILFTDIVGYAALMAESEERGRAARRRHRELVGAFVGQFHGESIEARGDESLSVFQSALDAVNCAPVATSRRRGCRSRSASFRPAVGGPPRTNSRPSRSASRRDRCP